MLAKIPINFLVRSASVRKLVVEAFQCLLVVFLIGQHVVKKTRRYYKIVKESQNLR